MIYKNPYILKISSGSKQIGGSNLKGMIECKKCFQKKETQEFYSHPETKNGCFGVCIECLKTKRNKKQRCDVHLCFKNNNLCRECLRMADLKQCKKCKQIQGVVYFYKDKSKKDGLESSCKDCKKAKDA